MPAGHGSASSASSRATDRPGCLLNSQTASQAASQGSQPGQPAKAARAPQCRDGSGTPRSRRSSLAGTLRRPGLTDCVFSRSCSRRNSRMAGRTSATPPGLCLPRPILYYTILYYTTLYYTITARHDDEVSDVRPGRHATAGSAGTAAYVYIYIYIYIYINL